MGEPAQEFENLYTEKFVINLVTDAIHRTPICSLRFNLRDDDAEGVPDGAILQAIQADRFKLMIAICSRLSGGKGAGGTND